MGTWFKIIFRHFLENVQKNTQKCEQFSYGTFAPQRRGVPANTVDTQGRKKRGPQHKVFVKKESVGGDDSKYRYVRVPFRGKVRKTNCFSMVFCAFYENKN